MFKCSFRSVSSLSFVEYVNKSSFELNSAAHSTYKKNICYHWFWPNRFSVQPIWIYIFFVLLLNYRLEWYMYAQKYMFICLVWLCLNRLMVMFDHKMDPNHVFIVQITSQTMWLHCNGHARKLYKKIKLTKSMDVVLLLYFFSPSSFTPSYVNYQSNKKYLKN